MKVIEHEGRTDELMKDIEFQTVIVTLDKSYVSHRER